MLYCKTKGGYDAMGLKYLSYEEELGVDLGIPHEIRNHRD